jgi:hypothetical protein
MQVKLLNQVIKSFLVLAFFASCAKSGYDNSARPRPLNNLPQVGQQGGGIGTPNVDGNPDTGSGRDRSQKNSNLPVVSFTEYEVTVNNQLEARLELQLNAPAIAPVYVQVYLINGTAIYDRDYTGFKGGNRAAERVRTIKFERGETRKTLPAIGAKEIIVNRQQDCRADFVARVDAMSLQGARVLNSDARITIPCSLPKPHEIIPLTAEFISTMITPEPGSSVAWAKIKFNRANDVEVEIQLETQDLTISGGYTLSTKTIVVKPNSLGVDIPVCLTRKNICEQAGTISDLIITHDFNLIVKEIKNADMSNRVARITAKEDPKTCKPKDEPPPPAEEPPPPPPPVVKPEPPTLPPPVVKVRFEKEKIEVPANQGKVSINLELVDNKPAKEVVKIHLRTEEGTAKPEQDYIMLDLELEIPVGTTSKQVILSLPKKDKCAGNKPSQKVSQENKSLIVKAVNVENAEMDNRFLEVNITPDLTECPVVKPPVKPRDPPKSS